MLAWLIRHGLVTQLRNFCWIKIPRRIKLLVAAEQRLAAAAKKKALAEDKKQQTENSTSPMDSPPSSPHLNPNNMVSSTHSLLSNSIASLRDEAAAADPASSVERELEQEELQDSFVLEPHQASSKESAWLEMMTRDQPPDIKALFDRCMKYLNGQHAIEKIAVREGISRKEVRRVLGALDEFLIFARHW